MLRWLILLISLSVSFNASASINLTSLNDNGIQQWEAKVFSGESIYQLLHYKNRPALKATSDNAASGLILNKKFDLLKTPYLNWSWLAEKKLSLFDEQTKKGDDYLARVYVVIKGGFKIWNTKSLSYVWSSNQKKGQAWNNAFAGSNVKMISARGKDAKTGQWYDEKRNVYQDLITYFGDKGSETENLKAYRYIDVIAIMTDTDNSGSTAEAYYGDIILSSE